MELAVRHQNVLETVQIDIEEDRRPGPLGSFDTGIERRFRERTVPATDLQGIAFDLRPVVEETDW